MPTSTRWATSARPRSTGSTTTIRASGSTSASGATWTSRRASAPTAKARSGWPSSTRPTSSWSRRRRIFAGNATDFYDQTAAFTLGGNAGVLLAMSSRVDIFGQVGLRWVSGMSAVDGLEGTGLETINDKSGALDGAVPHRHSCPVLIDGGHDAPRAQDPADRRSVRGARGRRALPGVGHGPRRGGARADEERLRAARRRGRRADARRARRLRPADRRRARHRERGDPLRGRRRHRLPHEADRARPAARRARAGSRRGSPPRSSARRGSASARRSRRAASTT